MAKVLARPARPQVDWCGRLKRGKTHHKPGARHRWLPRRRKPIPPDLGGVAGDWSERDRRIDALGA